MTLSGTTSSFEEIYALILQKVEEEGNSAEVGNGKPLDIHIAVGSQDSGNLPEGASDLGDGNWILVTDGDGNPIQRDPSDKENSFPGVTKEELQKIAADVASEVHEALAGSGQEAGRGMTDQLRVAEVGTSKMDWKQILRQWVLMNAKSDYRFTRPNRRYLARGMMVPGLVSESVTGVIAIDVSGSINKKDLRQLYHRTGADPEGAALARVACYLVFRWDPQNTASEPA